MPRKTKDQPALVTPIEIDDYRGREASRRPVKKLIYTAFFISTGCMAYALGVMNVPVLISSTFVMCISVISITQL